MKWTIVHTGIATHVIMLYEQRVYRSIGFFPRADCATRELLLACACRCK